LSSPQVPGGKPRDVSSHSQSPALNTELLEYKVGVPSTRHPPNVGITLGGFQVSLLLNSVSAAAVQTFVFFNIQSECEFNCSVHRFTLKAL